VYRLSGQKQRNWTHLSSRCDITSEHDIKLELSSWPGWLRVINKTSSGAVA
jgi:hypothetical protein